MKGLFEEVCGYFDKCIGEATEGQKISEAMWDIVSDEAKKQTYARYPEFENSINNDKSTSGRWGKFILDIKRRHVFYPVIEHGGADNEEVVPKPGNGTYKFVDLYRYLIDEIGRIPDNEMGNAIGRFLGFSRWISSPTMKSIEERDGYIFEEIQTVGYKAMFDPIEREKNEIRAQLQLLNDRLNKLETRK